MLSNLAAPAVFNYATNPNSKNHSMHPNSLNHSPLPPAIDTDSRETTETCATDPVVIDCSSSVYPNVSEEAKFHTTIADASSYKIVTCFCKQGEQLAKAVPTSRKLSDGSKNSTMSERMAYVCANDTCNFHRLMSSPNRRCSAPVIDEWSAEMSLLSSPKASTSPPNHVRTKSKILDTISIANEF